MTKPIIENIADEVEKRLKNITIANSYPIDATVVTSKRDTNFWNPAPGKIIIDQKEAVRNDEHSYPGNPPASAYDLQFEIWGYAGELDRKNEIGICDKSISDSQMIASLQKAIANNDTSWHTFDGNAFNAQVVATSTFDAPGGSGGMVILNVQYRTSELDPYTRR